MFCNNCGQNNLELASYCSSCGGLLKAIPKEESNASIDSSAALRFKKQSTQNAFQKILLLWGIFWFVVQLFYIPYYNDEQTILDTLWSDRGEIVWVRLVMQIAVLFTSCYFLYKYLGKYGVTRDVKYKRKARIEVSILLFFVLCLVALNVFLYVVTYTSQNRIERIDIETAQNEQQISLNSKKRDTRMAFWNLANRTFDLEAFKRNINDYWIFMSANIHDDEWLKSYYQEYYQVSRFDLFSAKLEKRAPQKTNILAENVGLSTPEELKRFILENSFNDNDKKTDLATKVLMIRNQEIQSERNALKVYNNSDIRKTNLILIIGLFIILYVFRALLYFVKSLFAEIK